jgi:hypothetical protein
MRTWENPFIERKRTTVLHIPASMTPIAMPMRASVLEPPPMTSM